jgi:hypothetical protein
MRTIKLTDTTALAFYFFTKAILILWITTLPSQSLHFVQEEIELTIGEENCLVCGKYYFSNQSPEEVNRAIYYPFYIDDSTLYPDSITVTDAIKNERIYFSKLSKGILFTIHLDPESIAIIEVTFIQKTLANKMEYILTTTKKWGEPLETVEFLIKIPACYQLKYISPDYDRMIKDHGFFMYKIARKQFYPDQNLVINWEE